MEGALFYLDICMEREDLRTDVMLALYIALLSISQGGVVICLGVFGLRLLSYAV